MKKNDGQWAAVGDLVFLVDSHNDIVPAKVSQISDRDYYFEPIVDDIKIPFRKFSKSRVGYTGGKVFRFKENAVAYQKSGNDVTGIIKDKIKEKLSRPQNEAMKYTQEDLDNAVKQAVQKSIAGMIVAMHRVAKIAPGRAAKIVDFAQNIINTFTHEELMKEAYEDKKKPLKKEKYENTNNNKQ